MRKHWRLYVFMVGLVYGVSISANTLNAQISYGENSLENNTILLKRGIGGTLRSSVVPDDAGRYTFYWEIREEEWATTATTLGGGALGIETISREYYTITFAATMDELAEVREWFRNNLREKSGQPIHLGDAKLVYKESGFGVNIYEAHQGDKKFRVQVNRKIAKDYFYPEYFTKKIAHELKNMSQLN